LKGKTQKSLFQKGGEEIEVADKTYYPSLKNNYGS
jgi:hypothetical protein